MTAPPDDGAQGIEAVVEQALAPVAIGPFVTIALLLLATAVVFMVVPSLNVEVFVATQRVTRLLPDPFWSMVTICGTGVIALALLSPTLSSRPGWYAAAVPAAALAGLFSNGLKRVYGLPRPPSVLDAAHLHVIGHALHANTFPSGHTVTAFTLAALLIFATRSWSRTAAWTLPLAALVAVSRIAVGAHWPADLAAGAVGGWLSGACGVALAAHWRGWNTPFGVRLLGLVSIGVGVALLFVDLGYPQAVALQYLMAAIAIASGATAVVRPHPEVALPARRA